MVCRCFPLFQRGYVQVPAVSFRRSTFWQLRKKQWRKKYGGSGIVTWGWDFWWFTDSIFNTAGTNTIATISLYTTVWMCDIYIIYTLHTLRMLTAHLKRASDNTVWMVPCQSSYSEVYVQSRSNLKQIVQSWTGVLTSSCLWKLQLFFNHRRGNVGFKAFSFVWKTSDGRWRHAGYPHVIPVARPPPAFAPLLVSIFSCLASGDQNLWNKLIAVPTVCLTAN